MNDTLEFIIVVTLLIVVVLGGTFACTIWYRYETENRTCRVTIKGKSFDAPQYRLQVTSAGDTTKVLLYHSAAQVVVDEAYVDKNITVICH